MAKNVVGLFESINDAQSAMQALQSAGFSSSNANLIRNASSNLTSTFGQLGIPQHDADLYQQGVQSGGALIVLQQLGDSEADQAAAILDRYNLVDLDNMSGRFSQSTSSTSSTSTSGSSGSMRTGTSSASMGSTTGSTRQRSYEGGEMVIPIVEEEIHVGKREVESGGVRVETHIEERPVNEQVTLREEEVHVERRAVNQRIDPSQIDSLVQEGTFEVRERDEQAVVSKEARIVEEVVVNKEAHERTETIQDTVRRTDVDVQEVQGETRTSGFRETGSASSSQMGSVSTGQTTGSSGEGVIESGASSLGNAVERGTGLDLDQDNDVGKRDTRNNY